MTTEKELDVLIPEAEGKWNVRVFKLKHLRQVRGFLAKYREAIVSEEGDLIRLILAQGDEALDDLVSLAALASDATADEIEEFEANEAFDLFTTIVEVNSSFFVQALTEASQRVSKAINPAAVA